MMAKTCLIHDPVGKSLGISRLESLRFIALDNIAIRFSEQLVTCGWRLLTIVVITVSAIHRTTAYLIFFPILFLFNASLSLYSAPSACTSVHPSTRQTHDIAIPHFSCLYRYSLRLFWMKSYRPVEIYRSFGGTSSLNIWDRRQKQRNICELSKDYIVLHPTQEVTIMFDFLVSWCGVWQHPSTRTHNLQPHTTRTTSNNQSYVPHAVNVCIVSSS